MTSVHDLLYPDRAHDPNRQFDGPQEGIVKSVGPKGVKFVLPDFDDQLLFGPAPYPRYGIEPAGAHNHGGGGVDDHDHEWTDPPVGARCLVVFVGAGIDRPWLVGWWVE